MIKNIKLNMEVLESMIYYWKATLDKEKVGEPYLVSIAENENMKYLYSADFDGESVRKVLSAISNREIFKGRSKAESRFWNNNMWMLEDLDYMEMMIQPLKVLNLDSIKAELSNAYEGDAEELEVVFVPGHLDVYYTDGNKLVVNFFRVKPSLYDDSVTIEDDDLTAYISKKLLELGK